LMLACREGLEPIVDFLLSRSDCDVNLTTPEGKTALMIATEKGRTDLVQKLVSSKSIQLDAKDSQGFTALHIAAQESQADIALILLKAGADVNAKRGNPTVCGLSRRIFSSCRALDPV
jgi:ankyrin repeat protein